MQIRTLGRVGLSRPFVLKIAKRSLLVCVILVVVVVLLPSKHGRGRPSSPSPHQRAIQEAQKSPQRLLRGNKSTSDLSSAFADMLPSIDEDTPLGGRYLSLVEAAKHPRNPNLIYDANYSLPVIDVPKIGLPLSNILYQRNLPERMQKVQLALTMKERGLGLTDEQNALLESIDVDTKDEIKEKIYHLRRQQEKTYFSQLRSRGQIESLPSGGERIVSSPFAPIRFPASLKNVRPDHWTGDYKVFLNITHFPWAKIPNCMTYTTTFAPAGSLVTAALASFPSSGNTWVRYLLESASGMFTGSLYDDSSLTRRGMYGEGVVFDSGMTILQKSHGYTTGDAMHLSHAERLSRNHMSELNKRGVIIVRNPFRALISHRNLDVGGHTGYAPQSHFVGQGWQDFVLLKIKLWKEFYIDWLEASRPQDLHLVLYEDLQLDPIMVVRKILEFLHLPVDEKRLDCLQRYPDGLFKRKPSRSLPKGLDPYQGHLRDTIYEAIKAVNKALQKRGKETLPLDLYEMFDPLEAKISQHIRNTKFIYDHDNHVT